MVWMVERNSFKYKLSVDFKEMQFFHIHHANFIHNIECQIVYFYFKLFGQATINLS